MLLLRIRRFVSLMIPMYKTSYKLIFKNPLSDKEFRYFFGKFYLYIYVLLKELMVKQDSNTACLQRVINTLREFKRIAMGIQIRKRTFPAKRSRGCCKKDGALPLCLDVRIVSVNLKLSFIRITSRFVTRDAWSKARPEYLHL